MKRLLHPILFTILFFNASHGFAQDFLEWATLANVTFEKKFSEEIGTEYDVANFGPFIKAFDGKMVSISGYVIPLDAMGISFVLSRNPNATCFFCGGGGPETVVDIKVKPSAFRRYEMDQQQTFKGILRLNPDNSKHFIYELVSAEPF